MRIWTLGSGSKGNAILLECDASCVMIDAGFPPRVLARRLASVGVRPEAIRAVVVTHEHVDHARGVAAAQARWNWQVYGTAGTLNAIDDLDERRCTALDCGAPLTIGSIQLELVPVPHDASAPAAVVATATRTGFRAGIAHDLGAVPDALRAAFVRLDLLLLESNHDEGLLRSGPYPPFLQARITGGSGHLSNRKSAALARELASPQLRELVLLHLSEVNNTPRHALEAARAAVGTARVRHAITAARQDLAAGPFGARDAGPQQLALAL